MKKVTYSLMLLLALFGSFWLPAAWTASSVGLTVDNILAGTGVTLDKTSTTVTVNSSIDNNSVTYAKIQDVTAASRLLGRGSAAGSGDPEEITLGSGLTMSGTALSATGSVDPASCTVGAGANSWFCGTSAAAAGASGTSLGNSASASGADAVAVGKSAVAGTAADVIAIGSGATSSAARSIAIGKTASATNADTVVIGNGASDNGWARGVVIGSGADSRDDSVAIGQAAAVTGSDGSIAIGGTATAEVSYSIAIGYSARATGGGTSGTIAIGYDATTSGTTGGISIGRSTNNSGPGSIVIGDTASSSTANQLVIGSSVVPITTAYIGEGVTSTSPQNLLISNTSGSGADVAGGNLTLRAGLATGNAATGDVHIAGANAGASGSTLQTAANRWTVKGGTGHLITGVDNTYDIGASGATRPRTLYLGTSLVTPAMTMATGAGSGKVLTSDTNGVGTWETPNSPITVGSTTATSGTVGSILFVATGPIVQQDNANFFWDDNSNRLGVTTSAPEFDIATGGNIARTIGQNRRTSGSVVNDLTIKGSDATSGTSNNYGASVVLEPGIPTGAGRAAVVIKGGMQNAASASGDGSTKTRMIVGVPTYAADGVTTSILELSSTGGGNAIHGGVIKYAVEVKAENGTEDHLQLEVGTVRYMVLTDSTDAVAHSDITKEDSAQLIRTGAGSLTVTFSVNATTRDIEVNANTSLTPDTGYPRIQYNVESVAGSATHRE